jgi:hypothetical protein
MHGSHVTVIINYHTGHDNIMWTDPDSIFVCLYSLVSDLSIGLQFEAYTATEAELSVEVCVTVEGNSLPSGRVAQYRILTVEQSATGK